MNILLENWFFLLIVVACVGMHFLHGHGHGKGKDTVVGAGDSPGGSGHMAATHGRTGGAGPQTGPDVIPKGGVAMLNIKVWTWALASWAAISFVVCVLWGAVTPNALHMHTFLESILPGFQWISAGSFVLGFVESFLLGAYAGLVFVPLHNFFFKRWGSSSEVSHRA